MNNPFKLSPDEHEAYYQEIEAEYLPKSLPREQPRAIITGGQPGAGKSGITDEAKDELAKAGGYVLIDADKLRKHSPQYKPAMLADDRLAANRTHPDAGPWASRLTFAAAEGRRNLIIDQTSKDPAAVEDLAGKLKLAGYTVELRVMGVNETVSQLRIATRYETMKAESGFGRYSTRDNHDLAYAGVAQTVARVEQNKTVDAIRIYDKNHVPIKENVLQDGEWLHQADAAERMHAERNRPLTLEERREIAAGYDELSIMIEAPERAATPAEKAEIEGLRTAAHDRLNSVSRKVAEFEEIKQAYQNEDPGIGSIVRRGTLIDAELRHEEFSARNLSAEQIKEIARKDIDDYSYLQGKPEQQKLAVLMGGMMGNEHYSSHMKENAPPDLDAALEAANVYEQQNTHEISLTSDREMEL